MKAKKIAKWTGITLAALIVLVAVVITLALWILNPERLTPMVEKYASEYVNADVDVDRVELSLWSTFPRLVVKVDSLTITSKALRHLTPEQLDSLPADAEKLLKLAGLRGGINLGALMRGVIKLHDVELLNPEVRLVEFDSSTANYQIALPSESDTTSTTLSLPQIAINRFRILGDTPISYYSRTDSTDLRISLLTTDLNGTEAPTYRLQVDGVGAGRVAHLLHLQNVAFGINGLVQWDVRNPYKVAFEDLDLNAAGVEMRLNAKLDFTDSLTLHGVDVYGASIKIADVLGLIHGLTNLHLPDLSTDLQAELHVTLGGPYKPGADEPLPAIHLEMNVPRGYLNYDCMELNEFEMRLSGDIYRGDINYSHFVVERLKAVGAGVGFMARGTLNADGSIDDALIDGEFDGSVNLARLPGPLQRRMPCSLAGEIRGESQFRFRPSEMAHMDLNAMKLNGKVRLGNFHLAMHDSSATAYIRRGELRFGANSTLRSDNFVVDSMAMASITLDTIAYSASGIRFNGADLTFGAGARHAERRRDTPTHIVPIGLRLTGRRLAMSSDSDSVRLRLRDLNARATLTRFEGNAHRPRLAVDVGAKRMNYNDRLNRFNLREADLHLLLHPRKHPRLSARGLEIYDSLQRLLPNLRLDSIYALTNAELRIERRIGRRLASEQDSLNRADSLSQRRARFKAEHSGDIDFAVDNSVRTWLRLWEASGAIKAARGRAFTPYFPVRNQLDSIDISFNTDSVVIRDTRYRSGQTSVMINGCISNITSALTSRRGAPISLDIDLDFDTLNINTFAQAAFAGSAFAARSDSATIKIGSAESDEAAQQAIDSAAAIGEQLAFVVPANLKANLNLRAREVLYADIWFQRIIGSIGISNGSIHLDRFAGYTEMGTMDLTALYTAPNLHDVNFAAGMVIRRLDLAKFLHMVPEIDSLLPLLNHIEGIITADLAMTTELDSLMNFKFHTLRAAMKLEGDSLVVLDNKTFRKVSKWLMFKHKNRNMIDHMEVELLVRDSKLDFMPFQFDIDRYKLGVWGGNTLDMDYNYHIAVLKSPIPFKFGINIRGHGDDFRIRLGRANFNPDKIVRQHQFTDTARINLVREIRNMFHFGVSSDKTNHKLVLTPQVQMNAPDEFNVSDELTHADSVLFMQEGVIDMTPAVADSIAAAQQLEQEELKAHDKHKKKDKKRRKKSGDDKKNQSKADAIRRDDGKRDDDTQQS